MKRENNTIEQKIKSLSSKEIIMAMIDGLLFPKTDMINVSTFGEMRYEKIQ